MQSRHCRWCQRPKFYDNNAVVPQLKKAPDTAWLKEPDKYAITNALKDLDRAFENYFRNPSHSASQAGRRKRHLNSRTGRIISAPKNRGTKTSRSTPRLAGSSCLSLWLGQDGCIAPRRRTAAERHGLQRAVRRVFRFYNFYRGRVRVVC